MPFTAPVGEEAPVLPLTGDAPARAFAGDVPARVGLAPPGPLVGDREGDAGALPGAALAGIALLREARGAASLLRR